MDISLIVAKSNNDVIGSQNRLPWRISEDLKLFKQLTLNKAVIMGRKTYESIGKPLPNRLNIVLTRNGFHGPSDVCVKRSLIDAINSAKAYAVENTQTEIMIIGGAEIFEEALDIATRIYLTNIPRDYDGDAYFPTNRIADWFTVLSEQRTTESEGLGFFEFKILSKFANCVGLSAAAAE